MEPVLFAWAYGWCTQKGIGGDKIFRATCMASVAIRLLGRVGSLSVRLSYTGVFEGVRLSPLKPTSWLLVVCGDLLLVCCWLILPAEFLLKTQNMVCILQLARFFFLQGMILVGNRSCLIQSIANVIIKCSLISILIWWGDNCFFFRTRLCLLKILWPVLLRNHIAAHL